MRHLLWVTTGSSAFCALIASAMTAVEHGDRGLDWRSVATVSMPWLVLLFVYWRFRLREAMGMHIAFPFLILVVVLSRLMLSTFGKPCSLVGLPTHVVAAFVLGGTVGFVFAALTLAWRLLATFRG